MTIVLSQTTGVQGDRDEVAIDLQRLRRHTRAVRDNPDVVHAILSFLLEDPPNASAAREVLGECDWDTQMDLWSCSPTAGGIWTTWQRDALKYGELRRSYDTWLARTGRPDTRSER